MRSRCVKMQCGVASNPYGDRVVVRSKLVLRRRAYVTSLLLELMSVSTDTRRLTQMRFICAIHGVDVQVEKIPPPLEMISSTLLGRTNTTKNRIIPT
jgi:hypothetical protein